MKIIIIEDDNNIVNPIKASLSHYNFVVDAAKNGQTGLELIKKNIYDLIILDLNLPDLNGEEICKIVRKNGIMLPILIISGDNQVNRKINLLDLGADDYLNKPFSIAELISRVKALLRRPEKISSPLIKIDNLEIDKQKQILKINHKEVYLTKKEFLILEYLIDHSGVVISRNELMEHAWDMEANFFSKTIEMHIVNLRKKIDNQRKIPLIKTVSGRGYKFN
jgi:Response regulators consisting of a CheY-like receiver domain and a winged-helix DNA-binding domain